MSFAEARERAGLSQAAVAVELGVSPPAVCQWEKGKTSPKMPMLKKIAKLYGCTVDELLMDSNKAETVAG